MIGAMPWVCLMRHDKLGQICPLRSCVATGVVNFGIEVYLRNSGRSGTNRDAPCVGPLRPRCDHRKFPELLCRVGQGWDVSAGVFRLGKSRSFYSTRGISRFLTSGSQDPHSRNDRNV